jgi:sialate O-acetylesterase
LILTDVLAGEVWIASGQSNMEMPLRGFRNQPVEGALETVLDADDSELRFYLVKRNTSSTPLEDSEGRWVKSNPSDVRLVSAVAYYFSQYIRKTVKVPVAVITASWGGTPVESWLPPAELDTFSEEEVKQFATRKEQYRPGYLFNGMIHPFVHYKVRGAIWYQGESNWRKPESYTDFFARMITGWRSLWGLPEMPFYYTQIAPFAYEDETEMGSAYLREAQLKTLDVVEHTGMAVTLDIGAERNIHPPKKKEVGLRLALLALEKTYGFEELNAESPILSQTEVVDSKMRLHFDNDERGFVPRFGELKNFEIAGEDRVFYPASATITKEDFLDVYSEKVSDPVAVRYAWRNWVVGDLITTDGIPVSSFRTDDW